MKQMRHLFAVAILLAVSLSATAQTVVWEKDMSTLSGWTYTNPGVKVQSNNTLIQLNSWWNPWACLYQDTGVIIEPGVVYTLTARIISYAGGKAVPFSLQDASMSPWATIVSTAPATTTDFADYTLTFSSVEYSSYIGGHLAVYVSTHEPSGEVDITGADKSAWNNFAVTDMRIEKAGSVLAAHDPSPASDLNVLDDLNEVGSSGVNIDLSWATGLNPADFGSVNPAITGHYFYIRENEPNLVDVAPVLVDEGAVTDTGSVSLQGLNYGSVYYWRVDESVNNSGPSDPNTINGPVWAFETVQAVPNITLSPRDILVGPGETAVFHIEATSPTMVHYDWYLSVDKVLNTGVDMYLGQTADPNPDLSYTASLSDAGQYVICRVSNDGGSETADSVPALLEVKRLFGHWKMDGDLTDSSGNGWDAIGWHADAVNRDNGYEITPHFTVGADDTDPGAWTAAPASNSDPNHIVVMSSRGSDAFNFYKLGLTVSAWVKYGGQKPCGIANWRNTARNRGWAFMTENNKLMLRYQNGGTATSTGTLAAGRWYHVVGTYTADDATHGRLQLYIDGVPDGAANSTLTSTATPDDDVFAIGSEFGLVHPSSWTREWPGQIDDFRVYTYPLDQREVLDVYNDIAEKSLCLDEYASGVDVSGPEGTPDCRVDLYDLAEIAAGWMTCGLYPACQ